MLPGVRQYAIQRLTHTDFTRDLDATTEELRLLLDLAAAVKRSPAEYRMALSGQSLALLFEKPSLRTRVTFELAIQQLGGFAVLDEGRIGVREPLKDLARNLDQLSFRHCGLARTASKRSTIWRSGLPFQSSTR